MNAEIGILVGTRPEIIKLAPVMQICEKNDVSYTLIHTGQHYSDSLNAVFFDQLELPTPEYNLGVGSSSHGEQTGEMIIKLEEILHEVAPDTLLVQGDTNSVLAGAVAASKLPVELGHVEAGLRSFDRQMPEETNRVIADHVSDYLFAPSEQSKQNLTTEGISEHRITVTGNTVVDALYKYRTLSKQKSMILKDLAIEDEMFFVLTAHRAENVDNESRLQALLTSVGETAADHGVSVIYPIHPHTRNRIGEFGITVPDRIRLVEPLDYLDFVRLEAEAALILTDSGGVQEEACILGVPCVTLRESTERPETIEVGANELADPVSEDLSESVDRMIQESGSWQNPFGDGHASHRILQTVVPQLSRGEA